MKKYFCLLLALLMAVSCFAACSDDKDSSSKTDDDITADESDSTVYQSMLGDPVDMGGREFFILQRWFGYDKGDTIDFQGEVIWDPSEEEGQMSNINLAKRKAKAAVEKAYNCKINGEMVQDGAGPIRETLRQELESGNHTIDFCFESYYYYPSLLVNDNLVDLKTLGIQFDKPWWDQNAVADMSVANKLYYACGDINTYDNDGTFVMLFNKDLYKANGGDPAELYQMAKDGTWTFDALSAKVKGFGKDSNGDGKRDEFDTYGLLTELGNLYKHVIAAGEKTVTKNSDDLPEFTFGNERVYNSFNAAVELYKNSNDVLVANIEQYSSKYEPVDLYTNTVINAFKEGRGLFYMTSLIHLPYFRDMENDFGILPIPKYDSTQPRYYHTMGAHTTSCVFVPNSTLAYGEKGTQIGTILDALGAYSKDYLTPEYYERQLKRGDASDKESSEMLDLIFGSCTYDLGAIFGSAWGDPIAMCESLTVNLQSTIDSKSMSIELSIEETVNKLTAEE